MYKGNLKTNLNTYSNSHASLISISRLCLTLTMRLSRLTQLSSSRSHASESLKKIFPSHDLWSASHPHGHDLLLDFFFLPLSRSRPLCFNGFINHQVWNFTFFLCVWFLITWLLDSEILKSSFFFNFFFLSLTLSIHLLCSVLCFIMYCVIKWTLKLSRHLFKFFL